MRKGFSLIELAIALTVIGLVVGGVLVGKDLVRAAEIRSVLNDVDAFKSAVATFQSKYRALPGDLSNAASYWASTSNGDGDEQIDYLLGAPGEEYNAWQQLALAEMIPGSYTGATNSLPPSRITNGYYRISYQSPVYGKSGHMISLNGMNTTYSVAHKALLSSRDMYALDLKADDGLADSGIIMGFNEQGVPGCVNNYITDATGTYIGTTDTITCKVFFVVSKQ